MNPPVYTYIYWCLPHVDWEKSILQSPKRLFIFTTFNYVGYCWWNFKSIIRAGRLVLIKRQTTWPSFRFELVNGSRVIVPRKGLLWRSVVFRLNTVQGEAGTREKTNSAGLIYELLLSTLYSTWQFSLWYEYTLKSGIIVNEYTLIFMTRVKKRRWV